MYSEKSPEYGGRLMTQRQVDTLTTDECRDRLENQEIGRVVFIDEEGPAALPVNYGIAGDEIIMRGNCEREGFFRIGFGECAGIVE